MKKLPLLPAVAIALEIQKRRESLNRLSTLYPRPGSRPFIRDVPFLDWRCTTNPGKLYFTIFHRPGNGFRLPAFKNEIKHACLLSDGDRTELAVTADKGARTVKTPHYAPNAMASVLVVEFRERRPSDDAPNSQ